MNAPFLLMPTHNPRRFIVCPYCDELHHFLPLKTGEKLLCTRCGSVMLAHCSDFRKALIYAITALILFVLAHTFPFITLNLQGEITTISVFSSVQALFDNGLFFLSLMITLFIIVAPLSYLLIVIWVILSFRFRVLSRLARRFLHWLHHLSPWNMLEVYLVGVMVTLVKIMQMASVKFENGFWAFCVLMFCSIMVNTQFDLRDAIFDRYDEDE